MYEITDKINKQIANNLKKFRKEAGLTQIELAKKINKSESTIRKYEAGTVRPSLETLIQLSDIYKVDVEELNSYSLSKEEALQREIEFNHSELIEEIDRSYRNFNDLIDTIIYTSLFSKTYGLNVNELSETYASELKQDIYKSIDWMCYKIKLELKEGDISINGNEES